MSSWKRPSFLLIAFIVLTALILAGCGAGKGSDKGTIIIGGALCLTGIQAPLDEPAVRAFVAQRLAEYKVPRSVEFVDTPLRDDAGKARRAAIRDEVIARRPAPERR